MNNTVKEIQGYFRQLRLSETSEELPQLLREAEKASWTYLEFLEAITVYELNKREAKSIERRMKWARFPYVKTLNEFKISEQSALTDRQLLQLQELSWLEQQFNLILLGPPGVGKTFLAVGLGIEAIHKGFQVYFVTMGEQWSELMGDQGITTAILDRLLHRVQVIHMDGDSYRMKNRQNIFPN